MIKQKDIVPGRVITDLVRTRTSEGEVLTVNAWMIIGFKEHIKRRHLNATARREGWHVVLLGFNGEIRNSKCHYYTYFDEVLASFDLGNCVCAIYPI